MNTTLKHMKMRLLSSVFVIVLTTLFLTAGVAQAAALTCGTWSVVKSPNVGGSRPSLGAVAAVSKSDVWAVGLHYSNNGSFPSRTLIEHWNGTSWSIVASPSPGSFYNELDGVATVSKSDVWAVGSFSNGFTMGPRTLIEHWDGTSWSVVAKPNHAALYGVAAVSASDVWAVGDLIEHWNGTSWSIVASPNPGKFSQLYKLAAVSANDIWAVGRFNTGNSILQTLIEHWNGTSWSVVKSPSPGSFDNALVGVAVVSTNDVWAAGGSENGNLRPHTLIEHWNGTNWSIVKSPSPGVTDNNLDAVAVVSANDIWAVGYDSNSSYISQTLIEHWNGSSWSVVKGATVGGGGLGGVASVPASGQLWAVGDSFSKNFDQHTLTEFYC